jgi:hypothetical protein
VFEQAIHHLKESDRGFEPATVSTAVLVDPWPNDPTNNSVSIETVQQPSCSQSVSSSNRRKSDASSPISEASLAIACKTRDRTRVQTAVCCGSARNADGTTDAMFVLVLKLMYRNEANLSRVLAVFRPGCRHLHCFYRSGKTHPLPSRHPRGEDMLGQFDSVRLE